MNKGIIIFGILVGLAIILLGGCKKEEPVEIPPTPDALAEFLESG